MTLRRRVKNQLKLVASNTKRVSGELEDVETGCGKSESSTRFLSTIASQDNYETILAARVLQVLPCISENPDTNSGFDVKQLVEAISSEFGCSNYPSTDVYAAIGLLSSFALIELDLNIFTLSKNGVNVVNDIKELSTTYPEFRIFTKRDDEFLPEYYELVPGTNVAGKRYKHLFSIISIPE